MLHLLTYIKFIAFEAEHFKPWARERARTLWAWGRLIAELKLSGRYALSPGGTIPPGSRPTPEGLEVMPHLK